MAPFYAEETCAATTARLKVHKKSEKLMNRKKKIKTTLLAKKKKANAKLHKSNKPKYISKAERAKLSEEAGKEADNTEGE